MKSNADVLIAGGGLMGCAAAIELADRGKSVIIFEKDVPGRHASGHNSGGVRAQGRDIKEVELACLSREMWSHHVAAVGSDCGFVSSPRLRVAESDDEMAILEKQHNSLKSKGFDHEILLDKKEVLQLSPNLSAHIVGGLICKTDGLANPMLTSKAYAETARKKGVVILSGTRIIDVSATGAGFTVTTCRQDTFQGELLLNAAGAWAGRFSELAGDPLPVFPAAPTMMVTDRMPGLLRGVSIGTTGRPLGLMAASQGTIVVGGGYRSPLDLDTERIWIDPLQMKAAAKIMLDVVPGLRDAQMMRCWAAFEGCLEDKVPAIGASTKVEGLFHCCGFSAHGFQLVPVMGRIMAQIMTGQAPQAAIHALSPSRFESSGS